MTNAMHNEDNYNGVPVTVTLPFRNATGGIEVQTQKLKVKGDANYWSTGNQDKNRLIGFWRYVDKDMMKVMLQPEIFDKITPTWVQADDAQTCPAFPVAGGTEYAHAADGTFDAAERKINVRLFVLPKRCGEADNLSKDLFKGQAGKVTEQ